MAATLLELKPGDKAIIEEVSESEASLMSRIMALGIVPGEVLEVLRKAPLGDPMQIKVGSTLISIRRTDCQLISVTPQSSNV